MTFRFPAQIAQAIEAQARATGRDRTTVVAEALGQAFGLSLPSKIPVTLEMLQQRIEQIETQVGDIERHVVSVEQTAHTSYDAQSGLSLLQDINSSLQILLSQPADEESSGRRVDSSALSTGEIVQYQQPSTFQEELEPTQLHINTRLASQVKLLERVLATVPDFVFVCDRQLRLLYINPVGMRTMGLGPHRTDQLALDAFDVPLEFKTQLMAQVETVFLTEWPISGDVELETSLLGTQHYEYTLSPIQLTDNGINAVLFRAKSVTDHKQLKAALEDAELRYHHLFESTEDSILILDASTQQILEANRNMSRRLGYTHQVLLRLDIDEIISGWKAVIGPGLTQTLQAHGKSAFDLELRHKDRNRIAVKGHSYLVEYGDRLVIQICMRDTDTGA